MSTKVFGVKIILQDKDTPVSENTGIGLYNVASSNSEFRWLQNGVTGVSNWNTSMLIENGIKPFTKEIDLRQGGSTALPGGGSVVIDNRDKFWKTIADLGITIDGLRLELWLFNDSSGSVYRVYQCKEPTWDATTYSIPYQKMNRNANILNLVNSLQFPFMDTDKMGEPIPATFGKIYPLIDESGVMTRKSLAKFPRVENYVDENTYNNAYFTGNNPEIKRFPITDDKTTESEPYIDVLLYTFSIATFPEYTDNTYVIIVDGNGTGNTPRKIVKFLYIIEPTTITLRIFLDNVFEEAISDVNDDTRSWVQIIKINRNYFDDLFKCKAFLDANGQEVSKPNAYFYDSETERYSRGADFGFEINGFDANKIDIDGNQHSTDMDSVEGMSIFPVTSFTEEDSATLDHWSNPKITYKFGDYTFEKKIDGIFVVEQAYCQIINHSFSYATCAYDKDHSSYAYAANSVHHIALPDLPCFHVFKFNLPKINIPKENIDKICFGVKIQSMGEVSYPFTGNWGESYNPNASSLHIVFRRFAYTKSSDVILSDKNFSYWQNLNPDTGIPVDDLPKEYYTTNTPTGYNAQHYQSSIAETIDGHAGLYKSIKGYSLFEITDDLDTYNLFIEGGILSYSHANETKTSTMKIYDIAIIVKLKTMSMKTEVLSPAAGRVFDDTWDGRKAATNLIETCGDLLEHVDRLQDYRDTCPCPASGWGIAYASSPLIHTASFDDISERSDKLAGQIFDFEKGYTDTIKQGICRDFDLAAWQDSAGYERALALPESKLDPVYTITLDDVTDRKQIKLFEPKQSELYPEPFVRYEKDPMTGEYTKGIYIKNSSATTYHSSYVDGVQNSAEAQALWQACHSLALKSHMISKPPTDLTDMTFANGAGGYSIALHHLQRWIAWQDYQEIELPLHFNVAGSWQECTPVNILLSHQTSNVSRSALIERATVNPNPPYDVMLRAIMYA